MQVLKVTLMVLLFSACSDRPAREKFPGPPGRTTDFQQAQAQQAVMGGTDSFSQRFQNSDNRQNNDPKLVTTGTLTLDSKIKVPENFTLFVALRRPEGGPPLAVMRLPNVKFPYKFSLGPQNVMIPGTKLEGEAVLSAAIDQDGDPISKSPGDSAGFMTTTIGKKNLELSLDKAY